MEIWITILSIVVGYLLGSLSFIRIFAHFIQPNTNIELVEVRFSGTNDIFRSDSVSATAARIHMGTKYGLLTGLLDMLKVALPTLCFLIWQPDQPYFLFTAAAGLVGHDWPIYHHFKGGRGESAIYGALLVINPLGVLATTAAGMVLGLTIGHILVFRWSGLLLMIPWLWFTTNSWPHLGYILFVNLIYWITMRPELVQYFELNKSGASLSQETIAREFGMGASLGRIMDKYSILAFYEKIRKK